MKLISYVALCWLSLLCASHVHAQAETPAADGGTVGLTIGGMPEGPSSYEYTSPLKRFGINLGVGSYAVNALVGLFYLVYVYPTQALLDVGAFEPVMPWLLVPIAGPWFAQYTRHVKDKPAWRVVLITDAALQAAGLLIGLLGAALSGTREREPEPEATGFDVTWGVAGALGPATGVTVSLRTF